MAKERLSKAIAAAGVASRRGADTLIENGDVTVNGQVITEPGLKVDPEVDHIKVLGKRLPPPPAKVYVLVNKPVGVISTTTKSDGRRTLIQFLEPLRETVQPVERLDTASEGMVLCTNDGELAYALSRPKAGIPKTYLVKVKGIPSEKVLDKLRVGVPLPDGRSLPMKVRQVSTTGKNAWLQVVMYESRPRLLERVLLKGGCPARKIKRTAFADITAREMPLGAFRWLLQDEVDHLKALAAKPPGIAHLKDISHQFRGPRPKLPDFEDFV